MTAFGGLDLTGRMPTTLRCRERDSNPEGPLENCKLQNPRYQPGQFLPPMPGLLGLYWTKKMVLSMIVRCPATRRRAYSLRGYDGCLDGPPSPSPPHPRTSKLRQRRQWDGCSNFTDSLSATPSTTPGSSGCYSRGACSTRSRLLS
jgi:hypothetical protein